MIKKIKHTFLLLVRFMRDNIQGISSIKAPLTEYMHTTYMIDTCAHYVEFLDLFTLLPKYVAKIGYVQFI
jgi:hypothetical protein